MVEKIKWLFDPELKKAMLEIEEILKKYDIAGNIFLASKTHTENRFFPSPSWSLAKVEKDEVGRLIGIRIKSKKEDFKSKEEQKEALALTMHYICQMRDFLARDFYFFDNFAEEVKKQIHVDHKSGYGYIAHRDIMNDED